MSFLNGPIGEARAGGVGQGGSNRGGLFFEGLIEKNIEWFDGFFVGY